MLIALGAIVPDDRLLLASRGGPVNASDVVAWLIFTELIKVGARSSSSNTSNPRFERDSHAGPHEIS